MPQFNQTSVIDLEQRGSWVWLPFSQVVFKACGVKHREDTHSYVFKLVEGNTTFVTYWTLHKKVDEINQGISQINI